MATETTPAQAALDEPDELTRADYLAALKASKDEIKADDVPSLAAGVAFKIFLSVFPALIAVVAVFSLVTAPEDLTRLQGQVSEFLPERAAAVVLDPLQDIVEGGGAGSGVLAAVGVLGGLWAAASAAATLVKALNRAYDVVEPRGFLGQRLVAVVITLALLVTLIGLVLLLVAGRPIQEALVPAQTGAVGMAIGTLVRFVAALVLLILLFAFVYWIGPNRERPEWRWMSFGAIVGVVGWLVVSGGFTFYVRTAGDYEATYGALGGVIVLMLWLQLSMLMLLVGAEINAELERIRERRIEAADAAGFGIAGGAEAELAVPPTLEGSALARAAEGLPASMPHAAGGAHRGPAAPSPVPPRGLEEATDGRGSPVRRIAGIATTAAALVAVLRASMKRGL